MVNKINAAIQVLPEAGGKLKYALVDEAIATIKNSGHRYRVCPFDTVVECTLSELQELLIAIHEHCKKAGTEKMITNVRIQADFYGDVTIEDKMEKYD